MTFLNSVEGIFKKATKINNKKNLKVEIKNDKDNDKIIIAITDRNSSEYKHNEDKFNCLGGDNGSIAIACGGYCDFAIEAKCADGKYRRYNYLTTVEGRPDEEKIEDNPEGFKFVFTFYKEKKYY